MSKKYDSITAKLIEHPGFSRAILYILRTAVLLFVLWNAWRYTDQLVPAGYFLAVFALSQIVGYVMYKTPLRWYILVLILLVLPWLARFVLFGFFTGIGSVVPGTASDLLFLQFDMGFFPMLIPFYVVTAMTWQFLTRRWFVLFEAAFSGLLVLAVFWPQAEYEISLFGHISVYAIAVTVLILMVLILLVFNHISSNRQSKKTSREVPQYIFTAVLLVPLLILLFFWAYNSYSEGAMSSTGAGLMKPTMFQFDFSDYIRLEDEIKLNDELVLLFQKEGPGEDFLLRRFVFSGYKPGSGFFANPNASTEEAVSTVPGKPASIPSEEYEGRVEEKQRIFLVNFDSASLLGLNYPVNIIPHRNWDKSSFVRIYTVLSKINADPGYMFELEPRKGLSEKKLEYYTFYGGDQDIKEFAENITADAGYYYAKVQAVNNFLRNEYYYSLKPGTAVDGDQLKHFLFKSKKGYCSYFAFSMAAMLRSIDVPARVAVGFRIFPETEVLGMYPVRSFQAHAWVEVYFGSYGWISFDPTSNELAPGEEFPFGTEYPVNDLEKYLREILENQDDLTVDTSEIEEMDPGRKTVLEQVFTGAAFLVRFWYIIIPLLYVSIVLILRFLPLLWEIFSAKGGFDLILRYRFFSQFLYQSGYAKGTDESALEYARRVDTDFNPGLEAYMELLLKYRYGDNFTEEDKQQAQQLYRSMFADYRAATPWYRQLLYLLSPVFPLRRQY